MILQGTDLPEFPLADPWFIERIEAQQLACMVSLHRRFLIHNSVVFLPFLSVPSADFDA
jgi:hypothetical protein